MASSDKPELLKLPAEVRDIVYEFVLTAPRSLFLNMYTSNRNHPVLYLPPDEHHPDVADHSLGGPMTDRTHDDQHYSYNQLKLVNKMLYKETHGLKLKFNDVRLIVPFDFGRLLWRLGSFVGRVKPDQRAWLSRLVLDTDFPFAQNENNLSTTVAQVEAAVEDVSDFCGAHPYVEVCWIWMVHYITYQPAPVGKTNTH